MILTGHEIKKQITQGRITIHPFSDDHINPNSYNYRMGDIILEMNPRDGYLDPKQVQTFRTVTMSSDGYVLYPGKLYLAHTMETIGSDHYVTTLIGRSTLGRLGLWLQVTADLGHVGTCQSWTLELKVVQPLRIYPGMHIGQVMFWHTAGIKNYYQGLYHRDTQARTSLIHYAKKL